VKTQNSLLIWSQVRNKKNNQPNHFAVFRDCGLAEFLFTKKKKKNLGHAIKIFKVLKLKDYYNITNSKLFRERTTDN
jgi:hypothetical protein